MNSQATDTDAVGTDAGDQWTRQWREEGYVVARGLFDAQRSARLLGVCERILGQWRECNPETGKAGGGQDATVMRHLNHSGYFASSRDGFSELMEAVADSRVLAVCRSILGEEVLFRCTSLFMNPLENSQDGNWHRDSQFHYPDEAVEREHIEAGGDAGHAVQLQVALTPSADVEVVPRSHKRWDLQGEYAIRRADEGRHNRSNDMPGAERVELAAGDAVAFNPFGLHRGRYHADKLRRTLMLTYTKSSTPLYDYFSKQPWFLEEGYLDGLSDEHRAFFVGFEAAYGDDWRHEAEEE